MTPIKPSHSNLSDPNSAPSPKRIGDQQALITQYGAYVRSIALKIKKTVARSVSLEDLVEYGMIGLLEAGERFDPNIGANFMTFAYYRIRGAIYDGLRGMGWMSRSEYARVRFEEKANTYLAQISEENLLDGEKSEERDLQNSQMLSNLATIYVTTLEGLENLQVVDPNAEQADNTVINDQTRDLLRQSFKKLSEQERQLIELYYFREISLEEAGEKLGLSKSWTSRLHARVIEKLHRILRQELKQT